MHQAQSDRPQSPTGRRPPPQSAKTRPKTNRKPQSDRLLGDSNPSQSHDGRLYSERSVFARALRHNGRPRDATRPCSSVRKQFWRVNRARRNQGLKAGAGGAERGGAGKRSGPGSPKVFMRLRIVPVTPAPPPRPLATRSAALIERRAIIVRLSFSTEIALAEGKLNRPGGRHSHGLHSAIETLMICFRRPFDFPFIDAAPRRTRCARRRQRRQNRGNTVTLRGQMRNPDTRAAPENLASREVHCSSAGQRKPIRQKGTPLLRLTMKRIEMKAVEVWP